jgi:hypothetical protein
MRPSMDWASQRRMSLIHNSGKCVGVRARQIRRMYESRWASASGLAAVQLARSCALTDSIAVLYHLGTNRGAS